MPWHIAMANSKVLPFQLDALCGQMRINLCMHVIGLTIDLCIACLFKN